MSTVFFSACGEKPTEKQYDEHDQDEPFLFRDVPAHDTVIEVNGIAFKMIYVPGGTFTMGASNRVGYEGYDPDADSDEMPTHRVTLSPFLIAETEVSQFLFLAVMGFNPSQTHNLDMPVHNVSYYMANRFIDTLCNLSHFRFRLPTEAEWEYAAKGGGKADSNYYFSGSFCADSVAWSFDNSDGTLHYVAMLKPNTLGLYDMSGNVAEWCSDWYGPYNSIDQTDPRADIIPEDFNKQKHAIRGGSYLQRPYYLRNTARQFYHSAIENKDMGLRLVLPVGKPSDI